jgi:acyl-[acyl-carrier-protein]-phospholipid O-acyltransferase / long-chain-fatty-acid--[acyl-carrier-protein] ligase
MATPNPVPCSRLPWLLERILRLFFRCLYRVRTRGAEHVPATGGALIVANHLSYVDPVLLQLACPRPILFVGAESVRRSHWFFEWVFDLTGTIPVAPENALQTTRRVVEALAEGEVVCLFPEGAISRTGQLHAIRRGFEVMARRAQVPVIPVYHDGIWGSVFSFSGNKLLFKSPRLKATPIFVAWGEPITADEAEPVRVRKALLDLGEQAFEERPVLRRHLARECVRALARRPGHVEIVDRTAERRPVKAGQLLAAAAALSRRIRRTIPERRVGIVLPPGAGAAIANLAVLCAGKVPVNLNFTAGKAAVEAALRIAGIRSVISANAMKQKVPAFPWPEKTLDLREEIAAAGGKKAILPWLLAAWILPNQAFPNLLGLPRVGDREEAGLLFTSGSSGEPKGVVLTHRNILANCWQISSLSILPETATLVGCLPIFHSFGFTVTLWYPMIRGCQVVTIPSPLESRKIVDAIREEGATVLVGAPTFLRPIMKKAETAELRTLDLVVSGAEKMPLDLHAAFMEKHHIDVMQGYGLTETSPVTNVNQPDPPVLTETAEHQPGKRLGTVGRMLPGLTARVVDPDTGDDLPLTHTGMLLFKGANIFGGYLDDTEKTAAAFRDGWFVTGDLGKFDEDGFLTIEGRLSRFSKIGGEMVPHGTVEQAVIDAFAAEQADGPQVVVTGVPDSSKGESLVLLTTLALTADVLREKLLAAGLPALWIPRVIVHVETIPLLGTGKLDLKACRQLAAKAAG